MIPALNARRHPNGIAVIDDFGEMTFKELDDAANAVANGLLAKGVKGGDGVAILARNHRWFLVSVYGAAKVGARIILLNSEFSGPQIKEVSEREGAQDRHLRRRVHRRGRAGRTRARQAARAGHQPGQGRAVGQHRRDPRGADRAQQHADAAAQGRPSTRRSSS